MMKTLVGRLSVVFRDRSSFLIMKDSYYFYLINIKL